MTYDTRITRLTIVPKGNADYHPSATHIESEDDPGGGFIVRLRQCNDESENGIIQIDTEEWPFIVKAVDRIIQENEGKNK